MAPVITTKMPASLFTHKTHPRDITHCTQSLIRHHCYYQVRLCQQLAINTRRDTALRLEYRSRNILLKGLQYQGHFTSLWLFYVTVKPVLSDHYLMYPTWSLTSCMLMWVAAFNTSLTIDLCWHSPVVQEDHMLNATTFYMPNCGHSKAGLTVYGGSFI